MTNGGKSFKYNGFFYRVIELDYIKSGGIITMIIVRIKGGLGNQLFQYAAAYALSKRINQPIKIDKSFFPEQTLRSFKLSLFNLDCNDLVNGKDIPKVIKVINNRYINWMLRLLNFKIITIKKSFKYCVETKSRVNEWFFELNEKDIYIDGYFQSEEYFKDFKGDLIRQFKQNYKLEEEYLMLQKQMSQCESVAVHVRRGDFLKAQHNYNPHHYLLGEKYYENALSYIEKNLHNPIFFWFSDDIDWVKEQFGVRKDFRYVSLNTSHSDIDEMLLMSCCKNIVAANSTFSWWSSWLNERKNAIHICPAKRYGNESMIPENWVKIPIE